MSAERLREWVEDPSHIGRSVRSYQPTYANPAALRRDVTAVLDELVVERERTERLGREKAEAEQHMQIAIGRMYEAENKLRALSAASTQPAVLAEQEKPGENEEPGWR